MLLDVGVLWLILRISIKVDSSSPVFFPLLVWHCCILRKGSRGEVARVSKEPGAVSFGRMGPSP